MESERTVDWLGSNIVTNSSVKNKSSFSNMDKDFEIESNWFLQPFRTSAKASELVLIHCAACKRIVLSERFHLHSCQISSCEKICSLSQPLPPKNASTRDRANRGTATEAKNLSIEPQAKKPSASRPPGNKKKGLRKKGPSAGNKRKSSDTPGEADLKGTLEKSFCSSKGDTCSGRKLKTRKLTDVLKNGPKPIPCHLFSCIGFDARWKCRDPLQDRSDGLCGGQGLNRSGDGLEWPQDNTSQLGNLVEHKWRNEWCQLSLAGELKFPNEVRKQRSTHPIR